MNRRNESLSRTAQLVQNFGGKEIFGLAQSLAVGELVKSGQYAEAVTQSTEVNEFQEAEFKSVIWEGRDNFGKKAASAIYIYRLPGEAG